MVEDLFRETAGRYTPDVNVVNVLWAALHKAYTAKGRYYHTVTHLEHLLQALLPVKPLIAHWDDVTFAMYYHDVVYSATSKDNEEKSAALARKQLLTIHYPEDGIARCEKLILATKGHHVEADVTINYFTDADLSVLGAAEDVYTVYAQNIRKEYSVYPDLLYKPGRRKVLEHFLAMPRIFKTDVFFEQFEDAARRNLRQELHTLA